MNCAFTLRMQQVVLLSLLIAPGAGSAAAVSTSTAGMTIAVTNCKDSGPGSLRNAVARALSGDTVDMSGLACNAITLSTGAIVIPQQDLAFLGPGRDRLTVKGSEDRVFDHQGSGLLQLRKFSVANGSGYARGGCIHALGRVELRGVRVHHCRAGRGNAAYGGGIYALGDVSLYDSAVAFNTAATASSPNDPYDESARGGGIYSGRRLRIERSHICDNVVRTSMGWRYETASGGGAHAVGRVTADRATVDGNTAGYGAGGLSAGGRVMIMNSTISRNTSDNAGGIDVHGSANGGTTVTIRNSTLSGNTGGQYFGLDSILPYGSALHVYAVDTTTISNSTIAFNRSISSDTDACGGAVYAGEEYSSGQLHLESTIVAGNVCNDGGGDQPLDVRAPSIEGSRSLVQVATSAVPADTITADPQLAPLAANGGPTRTHALPATSAAVDAGANPYGLKYDQRGQGHARVKGARADIGAYER